MFSLIDQREGKEMRDNEGFVGFSPRVPPSFTNNVCHYPNRFVAESIPALKYPANNLSRATLGLLLEV